MLDQRTRERVIDVMKHDLGAAGIIYIGRAGDYDRLFGRTLRLLQDADSRPSGRAPVDTLTAAI